MKPIDFLGEKVEYDPFNEEILNARGKLVVSLECSWNIELQDEVGQWIADAINEKLDREMLR